MPEFPDAQHYIYGHTDYPLSEEGRQQAETLGNVFSNILFDRVVSSDLLRARETARIILDQNWQLHPPVEVRPEFREIYMGEWEGVPVENIREKFAQLYEERGRDIVNTRIPGGESFTELQARASAAFRALLDEPMRSHNLLVVAHGGFFWSLLCELFAFPLERLRSFRFDYCGVHLIEEAEGDLTLVSYNWTPFLAR